MIEPQPHPGGERGHDALLTLSRAAAEMGRLPDQVPAIALRAAVDSGTTAPRSGCSRTMG